MARAAEAPNQPRANNDAECILTVQTERVKEIKWLTQDFFPPIGVRLVRVHPLVVLTSDPVPHVSAKLVGRERNCFHCFDTLRLSCLPFRLLRKRAAVFPSLPLRGPPPVVVTPSSSSSTRSSALLLLLGGWQAKKLAHYRRPLDWSVERIAPLTHQLTQKYISVADITSALPKTKQNKIK